MFKNQRTKKIELANRRLEESFLSRKTLIKENDAKSDLINQVIQMDQEFNNDPKYLEYEKKYALAKIKKTLSDNMTRGRQFLGIDPNEVDDDMVEMMMSLMGGAKQPITPEIVINHKDSVKDTVNNIMTLANKGGDRELSDKLQNFLNLLNQL